MGQTQVQTWCAVGQTCVRPRSDPDLTRVRPGPDLNPTASLNKDLPIYPCQALKGSFLRGAGILCAASLPYNYEPSSY